MARVTLTSVVLIGFLVALSGCAASPHPSVVHPFVANNTNHERHEVTLSQLIDAGERLEIDLGQRMKKRGWSVILDIVNDRSGPEHISLFSSGKPMTSLTLDEGEHCYIWLDFGTDPSSDSNMAGISNGVAIAIHNERVSPTITVGGRFLSEKNYEEVDGKIYRRKLHDKGLWGLDKN